MRYFRPKSLTWWAGFVSVVLGVWLALDPTPTLLVFGDVIATLLGAEGTGEPAAAPAMLILTGLGVIGIGDKIERDIEERRFYANRR